jgi:hypothetical protein
MFSRRAMKRSESNPATLKITGFDHDTRAYMGLMSVHWFEVGTNVANIVLANILPRVWKTTYQEHWGKYKKISAKFKKYKNILFFQFLNI